MFPAGVTNKEDPQRIIVVSFPLVHLSHPYATHPNTPGPPPRFFQTEFNLDHMMPTGREHEATKVLDEDIDIQAAKSLHGVVAHMASAREEVGRFCVVGGCVCP